MIRELLVLPKKLPRVKHCHTTGGYRRHRMHVHREIEILSLKEGVMHFNINTSYEELNPGDFLIVNSSVPHSNYLSEAVYTFVQFDFHELLDVDDSEALLSECDNIPYLSSYLKLSPSSPSYEYFSGLYNLILEYSDPESSTEYLKGCFYRLYDFMQEHRMFAPEDNALSAPGFSKIREIVDFINAHYNENITLDELSAKIGLSSEYLCRCFKKLTNYTIFEYINYVRIKNVERLLVTTDIPISQIAGMTGFTSQTYFNRAFKKQFSFTPLKYKKIKRTIYEKDGMSAIHLNNEKGDIR